ncbi:MAG: cobalamin-independent methionine synthase II family protein [Candidatus Rokuibacteriota bacterium]
MTDETRANLSGMRVDHVGSLLRPESLKATFMRYAEGKASGEELRRAQDAGIRDVVTKQEAHDLPVVTDGEYRRLNWQVSFSDVEGWELWTRSGEGLRRYPDHRRPGEKPLDRGEDAVVTFRTPATARLRLIRNRPLEEYQFTRAAASRPVKLTLIGPDRICQMFDAAASRAIYPDPDSFLADVVSIEQRMLGELVEAGCDYVQIDEPSYTGYVDPPTLERLRAGGEDPTKHLERAIDADNRIIAGLPGATFGLHICRGNRASMWHREGTYDAIAERLFTGLNYHRLLLEYDSERAGTFEPLRFVPRGKIAVLGLITTKTGRVETADELKRRLEAASRYLPLEQLALSPQCGFASGMAGNLLTEAEQWRKLDVMLETARQVWGQL